MEGVATPTLNPTCLSSEGDSLDTSNIGQIRRNLERNFVLAQAPFLGENLLPFLALAFGAALVVGPGLALVRPPQNPRDDTDLERPPLIRTLVFIILGLVMTIWALASLLSG